MKDREKASRARLKIREVERARASHVAAMLRAEAMVAGSYVELKRVCGKSGCRCVAGHKHCSKYLSRSVGGRTQFVYVPSRDEVMISAKAGRYRHFREARAALMKLAMETAEAADGLQAALTESYPKEVRRRHKRR